jgi:ATP/maltotriose-dependent transcriptional regulator MalT/DNA-binding SARP family transcriptional activator
VLAAEYAESLGIAWALAALGPGDAQPSSVAARLQSALRRSGLTDLAASLASHSRASEPLAALADAVDSGDEPVLFVLDDVQHATGAADELVRLARELPEPHRMLLVARRLPAGCDRLRREPGVLHLGTSDLAFDETDVAALYETGFSVALDRDEATALVHATGGWAAALVLAAPRIAERSLELASLEQQESVLAYLVHESLRSLPGETRDAVIALAHLPVITVEVARVVGGGDDLLATMTEAGLPVAHDSGRFELPGPVQDLLVRMAPLPASLASAVARAYSEHGLHEQALETCLLANDAEAAARFLGDLRPRDVESVDFEHIRHVVAALPEEVVRAHPRVFLQLARACEPAAEGQVRARALDRARPLARDLGDASLLRELDAETAKDLVRDGRVTEAEALAERLLPELDADDGATRARLLHTLGRVKSFEFDPEHLAEAQPLLVEAARLYGRIGEPTWKAQALLVLGAHVQFPQGRHDAALATLDEALAALPGASRFRAVVLTFRSDVLADLARYDELEANGAEARRIGEILGDQRILAYVAWTGARAASQSGDADATLALLREVERHRGDWFEHATGAEFLAEAAMLLDRVDQHVVARDYLDRARPRVEQAEQSIRLAEAALEARSGDPARAEELLAGLDLDSIETRDAWRILLLRACAALRRGDERAATFAADAFEQVASWTDAPIPFLRERALSERLLALAVEGGSPAAARIHVGELPIAISVLGRFDVREGGRAIDLPPGKPTALVKLVASRGSVPTEEAIEALWPEVEPESGRKRLRNVLNRLRAVGELVVRSEQALELAGGIEVDALRFADEAGRALSLARVRPGEAVVVARRAAARYHGELLPDDPYESWASVTREWLRGRYVELLDVLVDDAERTGELDEALRLQRRRLEVDPLDEAQYLRAARLLSAQGRRLAAAEMLRRGSALLERFGLPQPPAFGELAKTLQS